MRIWAMYFAILICLSLSGSVWPQGTVDQGCALVKLALGEAKRLKVGDTRRDVEKSWRLDNGVQIRTQAVYTYSKCAYIKIHVDFKGVGSPGLTKSPEDKVTAISKPYLDDPIQD